ncbi:MAG TPA: phage antirepressor Ant [Halomonas sp.]|nr:phage antirepressor Ant [Halomonas sp.]|tara:strand:- start:387 stop:1124 length:738 start_codon:yes stop_codon:yes gene_type:complete
MNDLISVTQSQIDGQAVQTVNARDLHAFLEVGKDFSTWMKDRIEQYGFLENQDFVCSPISGNEGRGGHNRKDYYATLDMAKELAMVERNEKGKQARQYFIECERRAKNPILAMSRLELMQLATQIESERVALEGKVAEQAPKVLGFERIADAEGSMCMRDSAKALQIRPIDLRNLLITQRWIYGRPGHSGWLAYQDRITQGVLVHKVDTVTRADGSDKVVEQVRITPKGLTKLAQILQSQQGRVA